MSYPVACDRRANTSVRPSGDQLRGISLAPPVVRGVSGPLPSAGRAYTCHVPVLLFRYAMSRPSGLQTGDRLLDSSVVSRESDSGARSYTKSS